MKNVAWAIKAALEKEVTVIFCAPSFPKRDFLKSVPGTRLSSLRNKLDDTNLDVFIQIHPELEMVEVDIIVNKKE